MARRVEKIAQRVAQAVNAGKAVKLETVDFGDPNRPKTCLEVDFPILPVNQVAVIEGNVWKPVYKMSKWWARRRSSVFRSMLIAASTKAPDDPSHAAKLVWDNFYANHQIKGAFKHLKVADIFMGGGTTLVEGTRLGMQMSGNDLNPVAWFVVKQELAKVDIDEVKRLIADIEAEVKPQIMPFYYCDGPNGEKGVWTYKPTGKEMGPDFDPLAIRPEERKDYSYEGPEIIYTFWAKHGPCQMMGCGHRTPIMASPVIAVKSMSIKCWAYKCSSCNNSFDIESVDARMAPNVSLYVAPDELPYAILSSDGHVICPNCQHVHVAVSHPTTGLNIKGKFAQRKLGKGRKKKIELSLLVHPEWLAGAPGIDKNGAEYGGSPQDGTFSTAAWNDERARNIRLLEVRGKLPKKVTCPETNVTFQTDKGGGTVPKRATFVCGSCGSQQSIFESIRASQKAGPSAGYAIHGFSAFHKASGGAGNGRFFAPFNQSISRQSTAAAVEWEIRKSSDLSGYWPISEIPFGFMTHICNGSIPNHGFTHWWTMFNSRQLLVHSQLLKAIAECGEYDWSVREYLLGAFQQYLRNQSSFTIWNFQASQLEPQFANNNYHPKSTFVENSVFANFGRGNWASCANSIIAAREWSENPWDLVSVELLSKIDPELSNSLKGKSEKVYPSDSVLGASVQQSSSTNLTQYTDSSLDLIITDPPFGDLLHYSELSDFFHVWMRLVLKNKYPESFEAEYTPKAMEVVANRAREPEDPDGFYQRLLTACWKEAYRILKPGGMLAFTFHHSKDEPWVSVLESLFDAGFYLEATYPVRSDETKGEGSFGSKQIEYDIIHVCRKRMEEPQKVSWARMRREVLDDVNQLTGMLENHVREGLPIADLQVIRRGKALEYFSRHYGKVYVDEDRPISVKDALIGISQLIDEDEDKNIEPVPVTAEPITRQFLRIFRNQTKLPRDQMQKMLRGSGMTHDEFEKRGWCFEIKKVFHLTEPLTFIRNWEGQERKPLIIDLDQALMIIGSCYDGSGIKATDILNSPNFKPHPALKSLLSWFSRHGQLQTIRYASSRAVTIYNNWVGDQDSVATQMLPFQEES